MDSSISPAVHDERRGPGAPSMLTPELARRILSLFLDRSLQGVADETGISVRTLRNWVRKGEQLESGLFHDVAVAFAASKQRRGLGNQPPTPEPLSDRREENGGARFPLSSEQATAGDPQSVNVSIMPPSITDCLIPWEGDALTPETLDLRALRVAMAATLPADDGGDTEAMATPPAKFQIHSVRSCDDGLQFELTPGEFEELRNQCEERYYSYGTQIVRPELRWPRDLASFTPRQRELVERRIRVLVRDRDHEFLEVQFTAAPWLVDPYSGRNE